MRPNSTPSRTTSGGRVNLKSTWFSLEADPRSDAQRAPLIGHREGSHDSINAGRERSHIHEPRGTRDGRPVWALLVRRWRRADRCRSKLIAVRVDTRT